MVGKSNEHGGHTKLSWNALLGFTMLMMLMIGQVDVQQQPLPHRVLVVGTKESPSFSMKDPDGKRTGMSIDLWRQIAAELRYCADVEQSPARTNQCRFAAKDSGARMA
jgi:hypothetical protein